MRQAVLAFLIAFVLVVIAQQARGHYAQSGWAYPPECCGGHDCSEIDEARVRVVEGGYLIDGKHFIANSRVRFSPDGLYHACWYPTPSNLHCFFRPDMGS